MKKSLTEALMVSDEVTYEIDKFIKEMIESVVSLSDMFEAIAEKYKDTERDLAVFTLGRYYEAYNSPLQILMGVLAPQLHKKDDEPIN